MILQPTHFGTVGHAIFGQKHNKTPWPRVILTTIANNKVGTKESLHSVFSKTSYPSRFTVVRLSQPGTFTQYIASLSPWETELLQHIEMTEDPFSIAVALEHGIRAVSDGSDCHQIQGAFGWVMSADRGERCASGMGPARSASPHAYRSEKLRTPLLIVFSPPPRGVHREARSMVWNYCYRQPARA